MFKTKIKDYTIYYSNKEEFKILKKEIFDQEIYNISLKNENSVIFDIGGHIGMATIYFKMKYPNSKITIFEPNPNVLHILQDNIFGNGIKNVNIKTVAIDSKKGIRDFYFDCSGNDCFSTASFLKGAWNGKQETRKIQINTEILSKYITQEIDLIKIDTEGNELKILQEIENKLNIVKNLIIEYHPIKKENLKKIIMLLKENKFEMKYILEGKEIKEPTNELMIIKASKKN
jgi:FkbM family methyltransferase